MNRGSIYKPGECLTYLSYQFKYGNDFHSHNKHDANVMKAHGRSLDKRMDT